MDRFEVHSRLMGKESAQLKKRSGWLKQAVLVAAFAAGLAPIAVNAQGAEEPAASAKQSAAEEKPAKKPARLEAGTLACKGKGGWGAIITSKKTFDCTFTSANRKVRGKYKGTIQKFGLDLGATGDTALTWIVFGPSSAVADSYVEGSLAGKYVGVGAEASLGVGLGANALVGGGDNHFALQPISVQVQTGISVAAGVQSLKLEYIGPLS